MFHYIVSRRYCLVHHVPTSDTWNPVVFQIVQLTTGNIPEKTHSWDLYKGYFKMNTLFHIVYSKPACQTKVIFFHLKKIHLYTFYGKLCPFFHSIMLEALEVF